MSALRHYELPCKVLPSISLLALGNIFHSSDLDKQRFSEGGDGGGPLECDNSYHQNSELIVALSTGWYAGGSRCGKRIKTTSTKTKRSVIAKVVEECDILTKKNHICENNGRWSNEKKHVA
ncbi:hypothetical protein NL676_031735 [Syzygium grande]|nr:hypothetical protein NL676_031735 [Syzygium grande]